MQGATEIEQFWQSRLSGCYWNSRISVQLSVVVTWETLR